MDFMNLNQSAHGDREYGFINARLNKQNKVVVGYWDRPEVKQEVADWMDVAVAYNESFNLKVARFGDNMRHVAVTDGDKIEAQIQDRKSTRLNSSHVAISYAVFCLKK